MKEKRKGYSKTRLFFKYYALAMIVVLGPVFVCNVFAMQYNNTLPELWDRCERLNVDGVGVRIEAYRRTKLIGEELHRIFFYTTNGQTWHEWWREYEDGVGAIGADCERMTIIDRNLVYYEFAITGSVRFYDGKKNYQISGWDLIQKDCFITEMHFESAKNGEIKLRCPGYDANDNYTYLMAKSNDRGKTWTLADD